MRARVKEGNRFGEAYPGDIVELSPDELERVPWCLEAVDEEPALAAPALDPFPPRIKQVDEELPPKPPAPVVDAGALPAIGLKSAETPAPKKGKRQ